MTPTDLRAILDRLGLKQQHAAKLIGVSERAMRSWVSPKGHVPPSIAVLFTILDRVPGAVEIAREASNAIAGMPTCRS